MAFLTETHQSITAWAKKLGLALDPVQESILHLGIRRGLLNCCRKWGKSTIIALMAAYFAVTRPNSTVLIAAPSSRQSEMLLQLVTRFLHQLDQPARCTQDRISLPNRSRILALPNQPDTIRGFTPDMIIIDEAAYVPEEIWDALFPMLSAAENGGWLWLMSTPAHPSGFFHRLVTAQKSRFTRIKVTAYECSRIKPEIIAEAKAYFPPDRFAREFLCEFAQPASAAFPEALVRSCFDPKLPDFLTHRLLYPLPAAPFSARPHNYIGVDFGQERDPSAIAIVEFAPVPTNQVDPVTRAPLFDCKLNLRYLESPPLGTPYTTVVDIAKRLSIHPRVQGASTIIPDASGLGQPIVEMFHQPPLLKATFVPVKITPGSECRVVKEYHHVAKQFLMTRLEGGFRRQKIGVGPTPLTDDFFKQLTSLDRETRPSGHLVYSTPSAGHHDDLVLATALAVWRAYEIHGRYLQAEGPVPILSDSGVWWR